MSDRLSPVTYRIGVTGHFASGKTAFISSITDDPVETVELNIGHAHIAFDYGKVQFDENVLLHLYGNPGAYPRRKGDDKTCKWLGN